MINEGLLDFININAGADARKGFRFQDYVGLYYILFYYKRNLDFEVYFETRDDIEVCINKKSNIKIQAKSTDISIHNICIDKKKATIYSKLIKKNDKIYESYRLCSCHCNDLKNNKKKYFEKIDNIMDDMYRIKDYPKFIFLNNFFIQNMPFRDDLTNARYYIETYSQKIENGEKRNLILGDKLDILLTTIVDLSCIRIKINSDIARKKFSTKDLNKIAKINEKDDLLKAILKKIEEKRNYKIKNEIEIAIIKIRINPSQELKALNDYAFPDIEWENDFDFIEEQVDFLGKRYNINNKKELYAWVVINTVNMEIKDEK